MLRLTRLSSCVVLLVATLSAACDTPEVTAGYRASKAVLDSCRAEASQQELTGQLGADLVGAWRQPAAGSHPLTQLASSPQVFVFEPDGGGEIWWTHRETSLLDGGYLTFEWRVDDGFLIVNELRAAEVVQNGPGSVIVERSNGDPVDAAGWIRCGDSFQIPDM